MLVCFLLTRLNFFVMLYEYFVGAHCRINCLAGSTMRTPVFHCLKSGPFIIFTTHFHLKTPDSWTHSHAAAMSLGSLWQVNIRFPYKQVPHRLCLTYGRSACKGSMFQFNFRGLMMSCCSAWCVTAPRTCCCTQATAAMLEAKADEATFLCTLWGKPDSCSLPLLYLHHISALKSHRDHRQVTQEGGMNGAMWCCHSNAMDHLNSIALL